MLSNLAKEQIKNHALKDKPNECCGLILASGDLISAFPCRNVSSDKTQHFQINPYDYLAASENNKIVGIYHSQSNLNPSDLDIMNAFGHNLKSYIYSFDGDIFIEVSEKHLKYEKYLNKNFEIGKQDCYTLVSNFYKDEYGINITNYKRDDNLFKITPNIIKENYEREGFIEIYNNEFKEGDILVFKNEHFGIYLEGDLLLHHHRGKTSNIEQFTDVWKRLLSNIYRYKNF